MKWWSWCEERAAGGWAVLLVVTVALVMWMMTHVNGQTEAVLEQCRTLRP